MLSQEIKDELSKIAHSYQATCKVLTNFPNPELNELISNCQFFSQALSSATQNVETLKTLKNSSEKISQNITQLLNTLAQKKGTQELMIDLAQIQITHELNLDQLKSIIDLTSNSPAFNN